MQYMANGMCMCVFSVTQSCSTLCNPMDQSPPGSSAHGILQAKILEWVAMPSLVNVSVYTNIVYINRKPNADKSHFFK